MMIARMLRGLVLVCLLATTVVAQEAKSAKDVVAGVVGAAEALLETLTDEQRDAVMFAFDDELQRQLWSNLPVGMFERRGLRMGDLNEAQQKAVFGLIKATLSENGYQQVIENVTAAEILRMQDGSENSQFGKDQFYVSILGTPSVTTPWMWQFGGHHLAFNVTIVGDRITHSPTLTGGQPMLYEWDGKEVRQMADEIEKAYEFAATLTEEQLEEAVLGNRHVDLNFGPTVRMIRPRNEGLRATALSDDQKTMLLDLIEGRVGLLNDTHTQMIMKTIESQLDDIYFSWYGPKSEDQAATYRIQGPSLIIEYAPQSLGGDAANHVHAMYRDPTNEYGAGFVAEQ